jgi:hypothetical protein
MRPGDQRSEFGLSFVFIKAGNTLTAAGPFCSGTHKNPCFRPDRGFIVKRARWNHAKAEFIDKHGNASATVTAECVPEPLGVGQFEGLDLFFAAVEAQTPVHEQVARVTRPGCFSAAPAMTVVEKPLLPRDGIGHCAA